MTCAGREQGPLRRCGDLRPVCPGGSRAGLVVLGPGVWDKGTFGELELRVGRARGRTVPAALVTQRRTASGWGRPR